MIFGKFKAKKVENYNICSPIKGSVIDITKTNDPLFKEEALGKGVGIIAEKLFFLLNMLLVLLQMMV